MNFKLDQESRNKKGKKTMEQLGSGEIKEAPYTCRYTSGHLQSWLQTELGLSTSIYAGLCNFATFSSSLGSLHFFCSLWNAPET